MIPEAYGNDFKTDLMKSEINFPAYMESYAVGCIDAICQVIDFSPHKKVVELGGGEELIHYSTLFFVWTHPVMILKFYIRCHAGR